MYQKGKFRGHQMSPISWASLRKVKVSAMKNHWAHAKANLIDSKCIFTQLCIVIFARSFGIRQLLGRRRKNLASDEKWIWSDGLSKLVFKMSPFFSVTQEKCLRIHLCHSNICNKMIRVGIRMCRNGDSSYFWRQIFCTLSLKPTQSVMRARGGERWSET